MLVTHARGDGPGTGADDGGIEVADEFDTDDEAPTDGPETTPRVAIVDPSGDRADHPADINDGTTEDEDQ